MLPTKERFTTDDFVTGILAALVLRNIPTISRQDIRLDGAFAKVFSEDLGEQAELHNLDIRFRIRQHPIHGDSFTLRDAILSAALRGLLTFDVPGGDIRLQINASWAQDILSGLPGSPEMYKGLAAKFVECYYETRSPDPIRHPSTDGDGRQNNPK